MATVRLHLGRYIPGDSPVHLLDPRTKMAALLAVSAAGMLLPSPVSLALLAGLTAAAYPVSGIPLRGLARGLRAFLWLFLLTALLQAFWTPGETLISLEAGPLALSVTREGLARGTAIFLRLATVIAAAGLVSATTSPNRLGAGLGRLASPLGRLGVPVGDLGLAFSIGLQFLPLLEIEAGEIREAQISRGIGHLHPNPLVRLAALPAVFVPLVARTFRRSEELAVAMLARGWRDGDGRTSLHPMRLGGRDALAGGAVAAAVALAALAG